MSDAGRPSREWLLYVHDMIKFGERVLSYTEGMDQDSFVADSLTYDATLRNLTLIGRQPPMCQTRSVTPTQRFPSVRSSGRVTVSCTVTSV